MAGLRRIAIISDHRRLHRHGHRTLVEQPGVTSGTPISVSGWPAIRPRHSAVISTDIASTAMPPAPPSPTLRSPAPTTSAPDIANTVISSNTIRIAAIAAIANTAITSTDNLSTDIANTAMPPARP
jgi:hypothetical protein